MFSKLFILTVVSLAFGSPSEKTGKYQKEYYETGKTKAEGWLSQGIKTGYWKFYHPNGKIAREGHYKNGKRSKYWHFFDQNGNTSQEGRYANGVKSGWWVFYDSQGKVDYKCQLSQGKKNGYCLQYNYGKLTSASKYTDDSKVKAWYSYRSFKQENSLSDLR